MSDFYADPMTRTARVEHTCQTCFRRIDPGERYRYQTGVFDGCWYTFRQCSHCEAIWLLYRPEDDEGLVSEGGYDAWQCDRAGDVTEARHIAQFRRHWRRMDGDLYPMPTRERVFA
jgi:hypothetical protein